MLIYVGIYVAAILEGEIYYSKVSADAIRGVLFWPAVLTCGALGGATGDQLWFYILRGRIHWLDRYPRLGKYRDRVIHHVHAHVCRPSARLKAESGTCVVERFDRPPPGSRSGPSSSRATVRETGTPGSRSFADAARGSLRRASRHVDGSARGKQRHAHAPAIR